jgi:uncharacterized cupredoxin-like copper-binding protein
MAAPSRGAAAEARQVTLFMRDFAFEPATIQLKPGEEVELIIRNAGERPHEWLVGSGLVRGPDGNGFQKDLFAILNPEITGSGYGLERGGLASRTAIPRVSSGLRVEPGGEVVLRFTVPAGVQGEWQTGCFLPGHYQMGMNGTLRIE